MPRSSNAVFQTTELLVEILSHVHIRTLLVSAQRVCKRWYDAIAQSAALQQALYFQPLRHADLKQVPNPLLDQVFWPWFETMKGPDDSERVYDRKSLTTLPLAKAGRHRTFLRQPKATWRRMLLTQPPATRLGCWMAELQNGSMPEWKMKILDFSNGLRMGKMYDLTQSWLSTTSNTGFRVYWDMANTRDLDSLFFVKMSAAYPTMLALRTKVDIILKGERWNSPQTKSVRADSAFANKFSYSHRESEDCLEPSSDGGYKPLHSYLED